MGNLEDLLDASICNGCTYLVTRSIIPYDYENYGLNIDSLKDEIKEEFNEDIGDDEDVLILNNICTLLNIEMDHAVMDCSHFDDGAPSTIFSKDPWEG